MWAKPLTGFGTQDSYTKLKKHLPTFFPLLKACLGNRQFRTGVKGEVSAVSYQPWGPPGQCPRTSAVPPVYIRPPTGTKRHDGRICWWRCHPELPYWYPSSLPLPPKVPKYNSKLASRVEEQNNWAQGNRSHFQVTTRSQPPIYLNNVTRNIAL